eukprot:9483282-Pyramimonas_sp.AAC.1
MPMSSTEYSYASSNILLREALRVTCTLPPTSFGKLYKCLAPPRAGIPRAHRCREALRGTCSAPRRNSSSLAMPKSSTRQEAHIGKLPWRAPGRSREVPQELWGAPLKRF